MKRAAILLFHPDPEKYVTGAFVKIGYFRTDDDLLFQDEIHGYLFEQVEKTLDLLFTKYLKAFISYEGLQRVERRLFPEAALREALLNAIAHKDYSSGILEWSSLDGQRSPFVNLAGVIETYFSVYQACGVLRFKNGRLYNVTNTPITTIDFR